MLHPMLSPARAKSTASFRGAFCKRQKFVARWPSQSRAADLGRLLFSMLAPQLLRARDCASAQDRVDNDLSTLGSRGHLPSAILRLPAFVSRSPPDNSCMYPSWISRSLCSAGIVRCIKPLAQSRNETNSSWVNGADKSGFIFQICASGSAVQASHPATIKLTHYRPFRLDV